MKIGHWWPAGPVQQPGDDHRYLEKILVSLLLLLPLLGLDRAVAQPVREPRIDGFDIQQVRRLEPGVELRFTVYGTAGGRASLRIEGVPRRVVLNETGAGVYQGVYVVDGRDRIPVQGGVTANLRLGNEVASMALDEPLVAEGRRGPDRNGGNRLRVERFDVQPLPVLRGGDELHFTLHGTPGAQVSVSFAGSNTRFVLDETRPGEYSGTYTIRNADRFAPDTAVMAIMRVGERSETVRLNQSLVAAPPAPVAPRPVRCDNCGVIESVNVVEVRRDANGNIVGTIAGGVVGAIIGSQVGSGNGTRAAEVVGAIGGAYAGNRIQANASRGNRFDVVVRLQGGAAQTISFETDPGFRAGERVRIVEGRVQREP